MQVTVHILKIPSIYRVVQKQQVAYCHSYDAISGDIFVLKIIFVLIFIMPTKTFSFSFFYPVLISFCYSQSVSVDN